MQASFRLMNKRTFATTVEAPKRELSHVTKDGRTSLKSYFFGNRDQGIFKMWFSKITPAAYPVLGAIALGVTMATWFSVRGLLYNPDVKIDKIQRSTTIRQNYEEGKAWVKHHASIRGDGVARKD